MKLFHNFIGCALLAATSFVNADTLVPVVIDLEGPYTVHGQQVKQVWTEGLQTCSIHVDGNETPAGTGSEQIALNVELGERTFEARCYGPAQQIGEQKLRQTLFGSYDFDANSVAKSQTIYLDRVNTVNLTLVMVESPSVTMFVNSAEIVESTDYTLVLRDGNEIPVSLGASKEVTYNWHYDNPPVAMKKDDFYLGSLVYERYNFSLMRQIQVTLEATDPEVNMNLEFRQTTALFDDTKGLLIDDYPTGIQTFKVYSVNPADYKVLIQNEDGSLVNVSGTIYSTDANFGFASGDTTYLQDDITISIDWSQIDTQGKVFRIILQEVEDI